MSEIIGPEQTDPETGAIEADGNRQQPGQTMTLDTNAREIVRAALDRAADQKRFIIALAGPPGVGKSTLSERLLTEFRQRDQSAAIVPMDGFHLDNDVLETRGHRPRKGAPFTFDADGFAALLGRLRAEPDKSIAIPVFDRGLDLARAGGRIIGPELRFLIIEGNYLLLDQPPWVHLSDLFDLTVMLKANAEELRARLVQRWVDYKMSFEDATSRAMGNDIPNADLVINNSRAADLSLECSD